MAQFFNLIFLCGAAILAYLLSQGFYEVHKGYKIWCELNYADDFQKHKQNKLYEKAYDSYLTQIENQPDLIAHKMATAHVNRLVKRGKVNELYSKMRVC